MLINVCTHVYLDGMIIIFCSLWCCTPGLYCNDYDITWQNDIQFSVNEAPSFISVPETKEYKDGDKLRFVCKARGKPIPTINWSKGGDTMLSNDDLTIDTKERSDKLEVESVVSIKKACLNDNSDNYRIEAVNEFGNVIHEFGCAGESE